jgi:hypothetical protein
MIEYNKIYWTILSYHYSEYNEYFQEPIQAMKLDENYLSTIWNVNDNEVVCDEDYLIEIDERYIFDNREDCFNAYINTVINPEVCLLNQQLEYLKLEKEKYTIK